MQNSTATGTFLQEPSNVLPDATNIQENDLELGMEDDDYFATSENLVASSNVDAAAVGESLYIYIYIFNGRPYSATAQAHTFCLLCFP